MALRSRPTVADIVPRLYEAAWNDAAWEPVLQDIELLLRASGVHVLVFERGEAAPVFGVTSRWPEANTEYVARFAEVDVRLPRALKLPHAVPTPHERLFRDGEMERSLIYNEYLSKFESENQTIARMDHSGGGSVILSAIRSRRFGPFESTENESMSVLAPHLLRSIEIRRAIGTVRGVWDAISKWLTSNRAVAVLLDRRGHTLEISGPAEILFDDGDGLTVRGSTLRAECPNDDALLQAAIARLCRGEQEPTRPARQFLAISRPSGRRPLSLMLIPLPAPPMHFGARYPVGLVVIRDPGNAADLDPELIAGAYGLTPREADFAQAFVGAASVAGAAAQLGIAESTARQYLKAVFDKTGTRNQARLMKLLMTLTA